MSKEEMPEAKKKEKAASNFTGKYEHKQNAQKPIEKKQFFEYLLLAAAGGLLVAAIVAAGNFLQSRRSDKPDLAIEVSAEQETEKTVVQSEEEKSSAIKGSDTSVEEPEPLTQETSIPEDEEPVRETGREKEEESAREVEPEEETAEEIDAEGEEMVNEDSQYILPASDSQYLTMSDLEGLSKEDCRLARNELYARHGRRFDDPELQAYFDACDWYEGRISPKDFSENQLNGYEVANRDLILQYEEKMGYQ